MNCFQDPILPCSNHPAVFFTEFHNISNSLVGRCCNSSIVSTLSQSKFYDQITPKGHEQVNRCSMVTACSCVRMFVGVMSGGYLSCTSWATVMVRSTRMVNFRMFVDRVVTVVYISEATAPSLWRFGVISIQKKVPKELPCWFRSTWFTRNSD